MTTKNLYEELFLSEIRKHRPDEISKIYMFLKNLTDTFLKDHTKKTIMKQAISNAAGKYKDCKTNSLDFIRQKINEKELER